MPLQQVPRTSRCQMTAVRQKQRNQKLQGQRLLEATPAQLSASAVVVSLPPPQLSNHELQGLCLDLQLPVQR